MMVILVTGGAGFIGSHLVDALLAKDYEVRVLDKMKPVQKVDHILGDVLNPMDIAEACRDVNYIFHLAAIADVGMALSNPEKCIEINEIGTVNILEMARSLEVERVLLASTTWVYGEQDEVSEESPIPQPDHIYTKTKIGQEHLLHSWNKIYGLPYTILRYGIPYGPKMRSNLVLAIFARKAMLGEPLTVYGDGEQGRCFIYVEDLAEGNVSALSERGKNQIFNIAGAEFITINMMVDALRSHFDEIEVGYEAGRIGDFKGVKVDISKAERLLGWKPITSFDEGLSKYIK